jgi:hypothetical protein
MDIENFLAAYLNEQGQIKNKDLKKIVTQLKVVIRNKIKNKKVRRDELKKILHESLYEMGWSSKQISLLNTTKKINKQKNNNVSPGFFNYKPSGDHGIAAKPSSNKFYQGGSPGLGKGKS